jgi:hypothetical protein
LSINSQHAERKINNEFDELLEEKAAEAGGTVTG